MNNISYTVLKLANGESIICELDYEQYDPTVTLPNRVFEIQNPLLMSFQKEFGPDGVREGLSLSRWLQPFSEQQYFTIPAITVITTAEASPGLIKYYEHVLKMMEHDFSEKSKKQIVERVEKKALEEYSNDEIYDELLEEIDTPSKSIH